MLKIIRWGILGTGVVARDFAEGLQSLPDAQLLAVGSRSQAKAEEFARLFSMPRAYKNYEDLVNDKDLDVIYIATPNHRHKDHCLLALEAGKSVLCEKPFALDAEEAREIIAVARRKQLFCMEAMWMRFMPVMSKLRNCLETGVIGEIRMVEANLGFPVAFDENNRFSNRQMGGGALFDLGIYTLSLASYLFGNPTQVVSQASIGSTGVDEQSAFILSYGQEKLAILHTSLCTQLSCEALIIGTRGRIRIHPPLYRPHKLSITRFQGPESSTPRQNGLNYVKKLPVVRSVYFRLERLFNERLEKIEERIEGNGYNYEAAEVMRCLRAGKLESEIMPLDETLRIVETMDTIRSQWNC
jgi:predicted dehydrogenase